jgi:UDP-2,3-diacylglucosamine pyrophosphatase LpxH
MGGLVHDGKLIAISDVHLDTWRQDDPDTYEAKLQAFLEFLVWAGQAGNCEHFAILGDLVDIPRPDHSPILPRFARVTQALVELMHAGVKVHYVIGNHDAGLVGIDVDMPLPPLQVSYPGLRLACGGLHVWMEHGHLMDAWLWEYLTRKIAALQPCPPQTAMAHFLKCPTGAPSSTPPSAAIYDTIYDALQWRPMQTGFTAEEKRYGLRLMSQHLDETFADVADEPGQLPSYHEEIHARLAELGLTVADLQGEGPLSEEALSLFMVVGSRYYSILPWRRAACCRMRELRHGAEPGVQAILMGHVHAPDRYVWECEETSVTYANCGTWSGTGGSYVTVENGEVRTHSRQWFDPLP